jgi:hypothetical protein
VTAVGLVQVDAVPAISEISQYSARSSQDIGISHQLGNVRSNLTLLTMHDEPRINTTADDVRTHTCTNRQS